MEENETNACDTEGNFGLCLYCLLFIVYDFYVKERYYCNKENLVKYGWTFVGACIKVSFEF